MYNNTLLSIRISKTFRGIFNSTKSKKMIRIYIIKTEITDNKKLIYGK